MISHAIETPQLPLRKSSNVWIGTGNGLVKKNLKRGLDALGGLQRFIKPGMSVFIKPNLTDAQDEMTGGVTDHRMARALIELIQEECQPGHIMVGENTQTGGIIARCFETHGWVDLCNEMNCELVDFEKEPDNWGHYHLDDAMILDEVVIPRKVVEADVFITMAILKNHGSAGVTGAIKNSFGLLCNEDRRQIHRYGAVEQAITDVARIRKPDISIIDGRIGMEGISGGSRFDHPRYANRIIIGDDPVATDVICAHVMEQNPRNCHLQWCDTYGIGNSNLDFVNIKGMTLEEAKVPFMSPADELEEMTEGRLHVYDLGSCSRCRIVSQGALNRFRTPESVMNEADIVYGPGDWNIEDSARRERCILLGECIQERYRKLGTWIPGCPLETDTFINAMSELGVVCNKCETPVKQFIDSHTDEELKFVRILTGNKTVYTGGANKASATDYVLIIGKCQSDYANRHITRSKAEFKEKGIDADINDYVGFIDTCDVTPERIEAEYLRLKANYEAGKKA